MRGEQQIYAQSRACIEDQIDNVLASINVDALKTGMLFSPEIIQLTVEKIQSYALKNVVVDPVMVTKVGADLLEQEALTLLKEQLIPLAAVVTPNIPEAEKLCGRTAITSVDDMKQAAAHIFALGPQYVLVKGGRLSGKRATDILYDGTTFTSFDAPRIDTTHTNGAGCTFSAAIAAELAHGKPMREAVQTAKAFITEAIRYGGAIGSDKRGPTYHAAYRKFGRK
ncbi:bifunctional hydroxymethylpyrimidine kinase/phosphomethylpyrimidine kinase [Numidum massiliense]|uniref:bifunctional hydroxymethylpyrimidine kinase/phosphomethylpyrimidine kinase n=1 Tax=Numidum massiliense TaxID=1522315 RepID=UPI0028FCB520|nr:bifunctional hydroxymethylpyrimidine kinase/phosphomethylpyrimidine kinase [Numidum massiliense]